MIVGVVVSTGETSRTEDEQSHRKVREVRGSRRSIDRSIDLRLYSATRLGRNFGRSSDKKAWKSRSGGVAQYPGSKSASGTRVVNSWKVESEKKRGGVSR